MIYWTRRQNGVPVAGDFDITAGFGTAIIIDQDTDIGYYITTEGEVRPLGGGGGISGETYIVVCSSEYGALTASTSVPKVTFRFPYDYLLSDIRASLTTAQPTGTTFSVDVKVGGTSIFTTLLTIDNTEKTSVTAATPFALTDDPLLIPEEAIVEIFLSAIGDAGATGLKVSFIGTRG